MLACNIIHDIQGKPSLVPLTPILRMNDAGPLMLGCNILQDMLHFQCMPI